MSFTPETGEGLSDATSYVSVENADAYFAGLHDPDEWDSASDGDKEVALQIATQWLDAHHSRRWIGTSRLADQSLDWPRTDAYWPDGHEMDYDSVPNPVIAACCELALLYINGDTLWQDIDNPGNIAESSVTAGPVSVTKKYASGGASQTKKYTKIARLLSDVLKRGDKILRG